MSNEERAEFTGLVAARLQISQGAAEQTLAQWDCTWASGVERLEAAQEGAMQLAQQTPGVAVAAAGWAALAMLLGLLVAAFGGAYGAVCRVRDTRDNYTLEPNRASSIPSGSIAQEASRVQLEAERRDSALRSRTAGSNSPVDSTHQREPSPSSPTRGQRTPKCAALVSVSTPSAATAPRTAPPRGRTPCGGRVWRRRSSTGCGWMRPVCRGRSLCRGR